MEVDDEPARFLPRDIEHRILDNFMDLDPTDQLTSALALTSMIQQLMASVGGVLQDAMQIAARRRQEGQGRDQGDTEVDVEVETEEAGLMQTTLSSSWYTLLHQLRTALEEMTKGARSSNVRWLQRRVHHRCTNSAAGQLLGHATGRAGELVALLTSALADLREVEDNDVAARECTTWVLEWWARLEPPLPISTGSLLAAGRAVPREDPVPIFLGRTVPDNASAGEESVDASTLGAPRGPPPPQPVRPLLSQSPTDEDLLLAAEAMEQAQRLQSERDREQAQQEAREEAYEKEMEIAYESHRAATYRDWEEWVLQQELARPVKRSRGMLQVVARTGNQGEPGVSSTLQVPLDAEAGGTLTLQFHFHDAKPTTPSTWPSPGGSCKQRLRGVEPERGGTDPDRPGESHG